MIQEFQAKVIANNSCCLEQILHLHLITIRCRKRVIYQRLLNHHLILLKERPGEFKVCPIVKRYACAELRRRHQLMILNLDKLTKHGLECEPKSRKWVSAANRHNYVQDLLVNVLEMLVPLVGIY